MRNKYNKKKIMTNRHHTRLSASNWGPVVKLLFSLLGVLVAAAILTFSTMFILEAVFSIDTPLSPDGVIGKIFDAVGIKQPLIVPATPYITPEPTPTPHPMEFFEGETEEQEVLFPTDMSYQWLASPYCSSGRIIFSAGKLINGKSLFCDLIRYDTSTGNMLKLNISSVNGQLLNPVFNDKYLVYVDGNAKDGGGDLCVVDLHSSSMKPAVIKKIYLGQPEIKLSGNYITWIERTGTSKDKIFICDLTTCETTVIYSFDASSYGTSMPSIYDTVICWAAEDNVPHDDGRGTSSIMYIDINGSSVSTYLPDTYVHDPEYNGSYFAWLDSPHGADANLYVSDGINAPVAIASGVIEFGIGSNFIAYGKDNAIYVYLFETGSSYRITPERETTQFLGVSDDLIMWMDVTSRERDIIRYIRLPKFDSASN